MSDENRLQTEEELWEVLNEPVVVEGKSKSAPKHKPLPKPAPKPKPVPKPVPVTEPAPVPVPVPEAKPKTEGRFARTGDAEFKAEEPQAPAAPAAGKKFDGFFFACMAGVAAVSVALTLIVSSMVGGEKPEKPAAPVETDPGISGEVIATEGPIETDPGLSQEIARLELENAELQAQLALQQQQISTLQAELMTLKGGDGSLSSAPSGGSGTGSEAADAQVEAYTIFNQIKDAYANFDRAKLEELIPQMDKRLTYLSSSDLNEYYLILEYVEQPSNG